MATMKLTSAAVDRIKAPDKGQDDYFDTTLPAFGLRVGRTKKMFFVIVRIHGKRSRLTLGRARIGDGPGLTLAEARKKAGEVIEEASQGKDPRQRKAAERAANRKRAESTFGTVADLYIERYAKKRKRSWREDQRILDSYVRPHWCDIPITDISRADVVDVLDAVEERAAARTGKGHYMANRTLACMRKLFNWAIDERALLEHSPVGRKMARGVEGDRKREFTHAEIQGLWKAADAVGGYKGPLVKMLMLTGQRAGVVAGMMHCEVDLDAATWTIPGDATGRSKNKLDHIVPLSAQAMAVYASMQRVAGREHVFTSGRRGDKAPSVGSKMAAELKAAAGFSNWCFQNLRSLVATKMKRPLGISNDIINLAQGRLDQSVLARHYDANDYLEEKRTALQAWATLLDEIVAGEKRANVVPMQEALHA